MNDSKAIFFPSQTKCLADTSSFSDAAHSEVLWNSQRVIYSLLKYHWKRVSSLWLPVGSGMKNTSHLHSLFNPKISQSVLEIIFLVTLLLCRSLLVKFQYFSARLLRAPILQYLEHSLCPVCPPSSFLLFRLRVAIAVSLTWIYSALSLGYKGLV